jgi:hypothetical protein
VLLPQIDELQPSPIGMVERRVASTTVVVAICEHPQTWPAEVLLTTALAA